MQSRCTLTTKPHVSEKIGPSHRGGEGESNYAADEPYEPAAAPGS